MERTAPLSLTLENYASTEKISDLPRKLSTDDAPPAPIGDISYYAPWGNLALCYRSSDYATGLGKLGEIDAGIEALSAAAPPSATFELMEE